jgi:hypothetical protein
MTVPEMLAAFKRWHVDAEELVRGGVRARDHHRPQAYGDMHGMLQHHTGPWSTVDGMKALLWDGRSDLPGPLCQFTVAPDGKVSIVSGGRANHAGAGAANVYQALVNDGATPAPGPDSVDGNAHLYGTEIMSAGASTSVYPDAQVQAAVRLDAAVCEHHGWRGNSVIRHATWTRRKVDTAGRSAHGDVLDVQFWQSEVNRALTVGPDAYSYPAGVKPPQPPTPPTPPTPPNPPSPLGDTVTAADVWNHRITVSKDKAWRDAHGYSQADYAASSLVIDTSWRVRELERTVSKLAATVAALASQVDALTKRGA